IRASTAVQFRTGERLEEEQAPACLHYSCDVVAEPQPRLISHRAADDLTYIRSAMERSSPFTAVPGAGGVVTGVIGLIAAVVGARQPTGERWLATWLG